MEPFALKQDMLLGTASPATQCEGGEEESSWIYWWGLGNVRDNASPAVAAQHRARWDADAELTKALGVQAHRVGIDWTAVEPHEGQFDDTALARYRGELTMLREGGIHTQIELHHFTNPAWFEDRGGFEREENLSCYLDYVEHAVSLLGDLADEILTFAEPNAYALGGYLGGNYPPGRNNPSACYRVLTHMAQCHVQAYERIHALCDARGWTHCRVSVSLHAADYFAADSRDPLARALVASAQSSVDAAFYAFCLGRSKLPMKYNKHLKPGRWMDFIALEWYGSAPVTTLRDTLPAAHPAYRRGGGTALVELLHTLHRTIALPLSVTLGGVEDEVRIPYLCEHFSALSRAALPVEQCFYVPLMDGFEWLDGQSRRLGLMAVDFLTQERALKDSTAFFVQLLRRRDADKDFLAQYGL